MTVNEMLHRNAKRVEEALEQYLPMEECPHQKLLEAMRYAVMDGGKRIRPTLVLEFCRVLDGDAEAALPLACAVEMVHSYSLVHDDLPCMDNDDMRRGKPSCHKAFGEDLALLAGDALLSLAFETALKTDCSRISSDRIVLATKELAAASGAMGMVGGQVTDLAQEGKKTSFEALRNMHALKTGRMIIAAAKMGCIAAGATEQQIQAAERYASDIGQVFQIVDDILDVTSDEKTLGKPIGSDEKNQKTTYYTLFGIERSMQMAREQTERAVQTIEETFGSKGSLLMELARLLCQRSS